MIKFEIGAFISAILIFLALSFNSYRVFNKHLENNIWIAQSYHIQAANNNFLANLREAESSERGFIITGDERYLEEFYVTLKTLDTTLKSLQKLTLINQAQRQRIQNIKSLADERIRLLKTGIDLRRNKGMISAIAFINIGDGKKAMDKISLISGQIGAEEERLLETRKAVSDSTKNDNMIIIILGTILTVLLFIGNFIFLRHYIERRRSSEEALLLLNEWFRQTLASLGDGVIATDKNGIITLINNSACKIIGWEKEEAVGLHIDLVFQITCESGKHMLNPALEAMKKDQIIVLPEPFILITKNQSKLFIEDSSAPIHNTNGELIGSVLIFRDVTEKKIAAEERNMFFDISTDMIGIACADGYFKKVNPAFEKTLGYTSSEFLSNPFTTYEHPEDAEASFEQLQKLISGEPVINFVNRYKNKKGEYRWIEWNVAIHGEKFYTVSRDITDRKTTETEIQKIKTILESIIENIPSAIYVKEPDNLRYIMLNKAAEEFLGCAKELVIGKNDYEIFSKAEADSFSNWDRQVLQSGIGLSHEFESIITKTGQRWISTRKIPIELVFGERPHVLGISDDITEKRHFDEQIKLINAELEQRVLEGTKKLLSKEVLWEHTLDNLLEGAQLIGHDWRYNFVNKSLIAKMGQTKEALIGRHLSEIYVESENLKLFKMMQVCMARRVHHHFESEVTLPDHSKKYFIISVSPVEDGLFILSIDITETKMAEISNKAYTQSLEEIMYMTSHQVRQPICQIKGIVSVLNHDVSKTELIDILDFIEESVNKLDQYTIELTDFINNARETDPEKPYLPLLISKKSKK